MQKGSARVDACTPGWKGEERQKWNASKVIPPTLAPRVLCYLHTDQPRMLITHCS